MPKKEQNCSYMYMYVCIYIYYIHVENIVEITEDPIEFTKVKYCNINTEKSITYLYIINKQKM
jgi:hypothetical protein